MSVLLRTACAASVVVLVASCGALIDPGVDDQVLEFPEREFRLDASEWEFAAGNVAPTLSCAMCGSREQDLCSGDACRVACDAPTQECRAETNLVLSETIDLLADGVGFAQLEGMTVSVVLDQVKFDVVSNNLNVSTPPLQIYLAPITVADPTDPRARWIGVVDPIQPGKTGAIDVDLTANGRADLQQYLGEYLTPFNLLVTGNVVVHAGDPLPTGNLVARVRVRGHADLGQ